MVLLGFLMLVRLLAFVSRVHGQPDFISIDCGLPGGEDAAYQDEGNNIYYSPDDQYIDTGINNPVDSNSTANLTRRYQSVRSFPDGNHHCYTLKPVRIGKKYLIRACFFYGNYDGLNSPPEFDLYMGADHWESLQQSDTSNGTCKEIITMASMKFISVCLLKTGNSTPFISVLNLRPLNDSMYSYVNASQSLALIGRVDFGQLPIIIRYPDDIYDRFWVGQRCLTNYVDLLNDFYYIDNKFLPPASVMRTWCEQSDVGNSLSFNWMANSSSEYHVFLHFAEFEVPLREFKIYLNDELWGHPVVLSNQTVQTVYTETPLSGESKYEITMEKLNSSALPPILNAFEIYTVKRVSQLATDKIDVDAIMDIKEIYEVKRNWMGDPCLPKEYSWDGLKCSYNGSNPSRIISLNLSSTGLTGEIAASIANLTSIESLDLSNNNLTGGVPEFLGELSSLQFLDISRNQLEGTLPMALQERWTNGSFSLRYEDNPYLFVPERHEKKRKKIPLLIIVPLVLAVVVLLLILVIIAWRRRGAKRPILMSYPTYSSTHQRIRKDKYLTSDNWHFKYNDVVRMTNNFERVIGVGGLGKVYRGCMTDGTYVAVKLISKSSTQGSKEFTIEAQLLMGVRHKNLVTLIGYCDEGKEIALVCEYMAEGNLKQHLSGTKNRADALDWGQRLRIALDVAKGLENLHYGCKPPIIHGDIKAENILLNERLEAKIGDFGLSKVYSLEEFTRIYSMNRTLGYLDPECYVAQKLNQKSDVYSFGIVLLELITGQPTMIKSSNSEKISIVNWVRNILDNGDIKKLVDPSLLGDYNTNSVWKAIGTARACTESISIQRPTIRDVVVELNDCLRMGIAPEITLNIKK